MTYLRGLIRRGAINRDASWSFEATDGNRLLGTEGNDWANYARHFLATDPAETEQTKTYYKYPVAKSNMVYRQGLIAAKQRGAAQGATAIVNAADNLLQMVDNAEKSWTVRISDYVKSLFTEPTKNDTELTGFIVEKDLTGAYRWFAWVSNKWVDREGEILTDAAHKDYIQFLDANPDKAPELWLWHTPGTAYEKQADWWDYNNGFLVFSGLLTDTEAQPYVNKTVTAEPIGVSHGFYKLAGTGKYITKYRTFEISPLPLDRAANSHTAFYLMMEEKMEEKQFEPRRRQFLVERLGEDHVKRLEEATEDRAKVLTEIGADWKELNDAYEAEIAAEKATEVKAAAEPMVKEVVASVIEAMNLEGLQNVLKAMNEQVAMIPAMEAKIAAMGAEIEALKALDDEKITKAFAPVETMIWDLSVTKAEKDTAAEKDVEELVKETTQAGFEWLSQVGVNVWGGK